MDMDEALAPPLSLGLGAGGGEAGRLACLVAPDLQDRMHHQTHRMAGRLQLAQHRIENEGPVGGRDLDDRMRPAFDVCAGSAAMRTAARSVRRRKKPKASRLISARTSARTQSDLGGRVLE
jgi:hypothetical protein